MSRRALSNKWIENSGKKLQNTKKCNITQFCQNDLLFWEKIHMLSSLLFVAHLFLKETWLVYFSKLSDVLPKKEENSNVHIFEHFFCKL